MSMESVKDILERIQKYCKTEEKTPCMILVGNKSDKKRQINKKDAEVRFH